MAQFHTLEIKEIRKETDDCVSLAFEVPESLMKEYQFLPGQYLTLKANIGGEELRRNYSLCSTPFDTELRVAVKQVPEGKFSTYANHSLRSGTQMEVMTPMGSFTAQPKAENEKYYVAFAAGSGITPIMSLMKTLLIKEPKSQFVLFYGNKKTDSIIFREEIEALKNLFLGRLSVYYILSKEQLGSEMFYGRIDSEKANFYFDHLIDVEDVDDFFLCGPEDMVQNVRDVLKGRKVEDKKVHFELFTTGLVNQQKAKEARKSIQSVFAEITMTLNGKTSTFEMEPSDENILEVAQKTGADVPYACKGGVCCTCKAKVTAGEVEMAVNYGLVQDEVDAGYVLTCQAKPITKKVSVSFEE